jgi:mannose-6-phosphate isomerase
MKIRPRRIEKPWGYELIWAETDDYVGKILHVRAGEALSLQYHEVKDETLFLLSGKMLFRAGPTEDALEELTFVSGDSFRVEPGMIHGMEAITDCDVLEASTAQLDDIVRLKDRYGRAPE